MAKRETKKAARGSRKREAAKPKADVPKPKPAGKRQQFGAAPASVSAGALASVNRVELAELMGVHQDTISDYVRQGMPVIERGGHGKEGAYNPSACFTWLRSRRGSGGKDAESAARTRSFAASAALNEMRLQKEMKELVPREQVEREGQAFVKALAAHVRALPSQLSQAGVIPRDQESAVARVCKQLLAEIAGWKTLADLELAAQIEMPAAS